MICQSKHHILRKMLQKIHFSLEKLVFKNFTIKFLFKQLLEIYILSLVNLLLRLTKIRIEFFEMLKNYFFWSGQNMGLPRHPSYCNLLFFAFQIFIASLFTFPDGSQVASELSYPFQNT